MEAAMPTPRKHDSAAARQAAYRVRCLEARRQELKRKSLPPVPLVPTIPGDARW